VDKAISNRHTLDQVLGIETSKKQPKRNARANHGGCNNDWVKNNTIGPANIKPADGRKGKNDTNHQCKHPAAIVVVEDQGFALVLGEIKFHYHPASQNYGNV
jgi:hypothetical protein